MKLAAFIWIAGLVIAHGQDQQIPDPGIFTNQYHLQLDHWFWMERVLREDPKFEPVKSSRQPNDGFLDRYSLRSATQAYTQCGIKLQKGEVFIYSVPSSTLIAKLTPDNHRKLVAIHRTISAWRKGRFDVWHQLPKFHTAVPTASNQRGWMQKHQYQKRELAATSYDVCFIGDSLTEFWGSAGWAIWKLEFGEMNIINLGIAGDRTENILFRLRQLDRRSTNPKLFVVLAGTNNLSKTPPDSVEHTLYGIEAIVKFLSKVHPDSRTLLLTLPPNGYNAKSDLRKRVLQTNTELKRHDFPAQVKLIDIYPIFANPDHTWKTGLTIDGTHFTRRGYELLSRVLLPEIEAL